MRLRSTTLLTLDAFGTLITPREPIAKQYADAARRHGLTGFSEDDIGKAFRMAFKNESRQHPNYGKTTDLGASNWWAKIIVAVFQKYSRSSDLPSGLIADLLNQFSSSRGYKLYPDVIPFFQMARDARQPSASPNPLSTTLIGVLSNSDSRIPSILSDLGLKVGSTRSGASCDDVPRELCHANDVEFVALSYDSGHEKPDVRAFGAAEELAGRLADGIEQRVHASSLIETSIATRKIDVSEIC